MIFGLLFTTLLVLFVVPALIAVQDDIGKLKNRLWGLYVPSSAE
jgi:hypothetical protein